MTEKTRIALVFGGSNDDKVNQVLFVPDATLSTHVARGLLPDAVPHADAAFSAGRAALLVHALTVQLQIKLFDRLGRHKPHGRPQDGLGNGFSVAEIVFVTLAEWLHELSRDELHIMAERQQLTAEMVGADASLHADQTGWHVGQPRLNLSAHEL